MVRGFIRVGIAPRSRVPQHLCVITVMGGIDLDFHEAALCADVSEVSITSVLAGDSNRANPPNIDCHRVGVFNNFAGMNQAIA